MWTHNRINTRSIEAYNLEEPTRGTGGLRERDESDHIDLNILIMDYQTRDIHDQDGVYTADFLIFQISGREIHNTAFTVEEGLTHLIFGDNIWRVENIYDYTNFKNFGLVKCEARKIRNVD